MDAAPNDCGDSNAGAYEDVVTEWGGMEKSSDNDGNGRKNNGERGGKEKNDGDEGHGSDGGNGGGEEKIKAKRGKGLTEFQMDILKKAVREEKLGKRSIAKKYGAAGLSNVNTIASAIKRMKTATASKKRGPPVTEGTDAKKTKSRT